MTPDELRKAKDRLEQGIRDLINEFQKATGFEVTDVYTRSVGSINGDKISSVQVDVKL